jgi:uncharacterized protein (DUF952 family)
MSLPTSLPKYLYKIHAFPDVPLTPLPQSSPPAYTLQSGTTTPVSSLDQSSGYIHLSTASQVPDTLARFFTGESAPVVVWILRLDLLGIAGESEGGKGSREVVRWEDVAEAGVFPVRPLLACVSYWTGVAK